MQALRFHHVGLACQSLEPEKAAHALLGFVPEGAVFHDPLQRIRGLFMVHGGMRIELLEPAGPDSPLQPFLQRGMKMYHQAFETDSIEESIGDLTKATGWQGHSVRAALTGLRKEGKELVRVKDQGGVTHYRLAAAA